MIFYDFFVELGKMKDFLVNSIRKNKKTCLLMSKKISPNLSKSNPHAHAGGPMLSNGKVFRFLVKKNINMTFVD